MKDEDNVPLSVEEAFLIPIETEPEQGRTWDAVPTERPLRMRRARTSESRDTNAEEKRLSIHDWAEEDRPREKLLEKGPEALSEAELLAILIGSGSTKESAVDLMRRVMNDHDNSLKVLGRMTLKELTAYNGLGPAKAVTIMAACELGKRRMREPADQKQAVDTSDALYEIFRSRMMDLRQEQCHMLMLDIRNRVIGYHVVSTGGLTSAQTDIRLVLRQALLSEAISIVFCHNHPSGNPHPSRHDDALTRQLVQACQVMDIRLMDHIIVGDGKYYSYYDDGKI